MAPRIDGRFLHVEGRRFLVRGVAYGTFAPDAQGVQFPAPSQVDADLTAMRAAGFNTVRTYTVPPPHMLDAAAAHGLRVMVGLPWSQHVAFLDDRRLERQIRRDAVSALHAVASHPAALLFAVGNEIPPAVVRWHGAARVERFLRDLYDELKGSAPEALLTYVNFPPTDYLDLECFDVCAFNVYLHREADLRAYLGRLHHIAGTRPLLLAEAGADSRRLGPEGQAEITARHVRVALEEGACGAVAFSWTDEWWRGGQPVDDWAFGLVDASRRPKPALPAVASAFASAPFAESARAAWPRVSVVVCAYDAAATLDDCLASLARLTYPDYEVIVVNDGSRDATGAIARRYGAVRLIDTPNRGLSAARNTGLAAATGAIVAYTDADVRADPDWLTYLVQPLLRDDLAGTGGPNVVPADDPWMAQCVARAPGGPTHVMLDDRIAEHVPGCNMAFRRDDLLAIGGFNPVFVRAGDDVDVCWRLQAAGRRIGFSASALVWHHHRPGIEAFWRQQVGYGESESWLSAHHPEKFSEGQMLWRGHIYSPLRFVRSLRERRLNTGVWGTAPFPSVYWSGRHSLAVLPHTAAWMTAATTLVIAGALLPAPSVAGWLVAAGAAAWATTAVRCLMFAWKADLRGVPSVGRLPGPVGRLAYRLLIAWLHVLQPLARMRGRIRGLWSMPAAAAAQDRPRPPWKPSLPTRHDAAAAGRVLIGGADERAFWSETWIAHTAVLEELAAVLRASRPAPVVEADDGWRTDRDLSVAVGRWGWLYTRVLVEEHAGGRCLVRTRASLGLGGAGIVKTAVAALVVLGAAFLQPAAGAAAMAAAGVLVGRGLWQAARTVAVLHRALERVSAAAGLLPLDGAAVSARPAAARVLAFRALRLAGIAAVAALMAFGRLPAAGDVDGAPPPAPGGVVNPGTFARGGVAVGRAGDLYVADPRQGGIRRLRPRPPLGAPLTSAEIATDGNPLLGTVIPLAAAADLAVAPNGDLYVADPFGHRVLRVSPGGQATTAAGAGTAGFAGDGVDAVAALLNGPTGVAVGPDGDLYIADTVNGRVRVVDQATGIIRTVAQLERPVAVAVSSEGALFIADAGALRVYRLNPTSGVVTTVAGTGEPGASGDGGPATQADIGVPAGLALGETAAGVALYVADVRNNRVRAIAPDGTISTLAPGYVPSPTRLAYHPAGWLYVKDLSPNGITAVAALPAPLTASRPAGGGPQGE